MLEQVSELLQKLCGVILLHFKERQQGQSRTHPFWLFDLHVHSLIMCTSAGFYLCCCYAVDSGVASWEGAKVCMRSEVIGAKRC